MKLDQAHIDKIRNAFEKMRSKEDLLQLLNEVKPLVYGDKAVPFELKQLSWYANPKKSKNRYAEFKIKKKNGTERSIHAPVRGLKSIQKTLSVVLQCIFDPHPAAMGFVRERSIVDNAKKHVGNNYVYNLDLKDFFPSIDQARVWKTLQLKPFNLNEESSVDRDYMGWQAFRDEHLKTVDVVELIRGNGRLYADTPIGTIFAPLSIDTEKEIFILLPNNFSESQKTGAKMDGEFFMVNKLPKPGRLDIANIIASLCCTEMEVERKNEQGEWEKVKRNVLPQGAPTSPVITNIVCQKLDYLLTGVAKRFKLNYSRYADDITFSSMHNVYQQGSDFLNELHRIIAEQNFHIKESKTRLQKNGFRKEVTGLLVNDKVNVQQRYIKQLRMWLYYWERYGYEKASGFFLQQYMADKGHLVKGKPDMANVISGKLDYLKMVRGEENPNYAKLKTKFEKIYGRLENVSINQIDIEEGGKKPLEATDIIPEEITFPVVHKARELERLLCKFSQNNSVLKYATHSWDYGRVDGYFDNYSDFIAKYDKSGRSVCFEIQKIKKTLGTKILHFLNTPNEGGKYFKKGESVDYFWGEHRIKFGWKSKELIEWTNINPLEDPFDFPLPETKIISRWGQDIELSKFSDIIGVFKGEIEIRPENSDLYNLFAELREKYLGRDFKVDVGKTLKGKQFYTDVHDFKRALNKIFRQISERTFYPNVSISAENFTEEGFTIVEVLHKKSMCEDKTSVEMLREIQDGDFGSILVYLENLCDWSIESLFADGAYRINYLSSNNIEMALTPINNAHGFKHIFKFYKS